MKKPTICYTAIFKNESKNVYRCLNSLKPIIDYVCICDTGSTDNTVQLIEQWCQKNNIPGYVGQEPFRDFGHNRTISVKMAQEKFPQATYLLLLDADMILKIQAGFKQRKKHLDQDTYLFEQVNSNLRYWNTRMIKASLKWECIGVTHEYWNSDQANKIENLKELWIDDIGDGGAKADKYQRDERLLKSQLILPNGQDINSNTDIKLISSLQIRYLYYLAQTYDCMQEYIKAIYWYRIRANSGNFGEEAYMAQYKIGACFANLGKYPEAIDNYMLAYDMNSERAEPYYQICKIYRERGKNKAAYDFAIRGKQIPIPINQKLFIEYHIYEYLFDYELSIVAWYDPKTRDESYQALYRVLEYSLTKTVWSDHLWAAYMNYVVIDMFEYRDSFEKFFDHINYNIRAGIIEKCDKHNTENSIKYGKVLLKKLPDKQGSNKTKKEWKKIINPIREKWEKI